MADLMSMLAMAGPQVQSLLSKLLQSGQMGAAAPMASAAGPAAAAPPPGPNAGAAWTGWNGVASPLQTYMPKTTWQDRILGASAALTNRNNPGAAAIGTMRANQGQRFADAMIQNAPNNQDAEDWALLRYYGFDPRKGGSGALRVLTRNLPGGRAQEYLTDSRGGLRPFGDPYDRYRPSSRVPRARPVGEPGHETDLWQYYDWNPDTGAYDRPLGGTFKQKVPSILDQMLEGAMTDSGGAKRADDQAGNGIYDNLVGAMSTAAGTARDWLTRWRYDRQNTGTTTPESSGSDPWAGYEDRRKRLDQRYRP